MSSTEFVDYATFRPENVSIVSPAAKTYDKPDGTKGSYFETFMQYAPLWCDGIRIQESDKAGKDGKKWNQYSAKLLFDLRAPEDQKCMDKINAFYARVVQLIFPHRGMLKMPHFTLETPGASLKELIYIPRDPATSEIIQGRTPNQWPKLSSGQYSKTMFTDLKGVKIDWKYLYDADFKGFPLIHYSHLYSGGNAKTSFQIKMVSMVIIEVIARKRITKQLSTISKIVEEDPDAINKLDEQLAALMAPQEESPFPNSRSGESINSPFPQILPPAGTGQPQMGGQPQVGGQPQMGGQPQVGINQPQMEIQSAPTSSNPLDAGIMTPISQPPPLQAFLATSEQGGQPTVGYSI